MRDEVIEDKERQRDSQTNRQRLSEKHLGWVERQLPQTNPVSCALVAMRPCTLPDFSASSLCLDKCRNQSGEEWNRLTQKRLRCSAAVRDCGTSSCYGPDSHRIRHAFRPLGDACDAAHIAANRDAFSCGTHRSGSLKDAGRGASLV